MKHILGHLRPVSHMLALERGIAVVGLVDKTRVGCLGGTTCEACCGGCTVWVDVTELGPETE